MDIIIQSLGFTASDELEVFIREKLDGLKADYIMRANVGLSFGSRSTPEHKCCEIRLEIPGNDYFVKKQELYFETAVSECVDILAMKIQKAKEMDIARRQAATVIMQDVAPAAFDEETESVY